MSIDYRRLVGSRIAAPFAAWTVGIPGAGLAFDASVNSVDFGNVPDTQFTNTTSFTIVSVFKPVVDGSFRNVLRKDTSSGTRSLWGIRKTNTNTLNVLFGNTGSTLGQITSTFTMTARVYATAVVRDVAADQIRLFADGILDNEVTDGSTGTWTVSLGNLRTSTDTDAEKWQGEKFLDIIFPFNALTNNEARQLTLDPYVMLRQAPLNVGRVPAVAAAFLGHGMLLSNTRNRLVI